MDFVENPLKHARTVEDLVSATVAYLASWTREELECLPDSCRPGRVSTGQDIEFWADHLFNQLDRVSLVTADERKLCRMTNHFMVASVRLRQIRATA